MKWIKKTLEGLRIVRLVWLTESWEGFGYKTELRIVRTHGPRAEPWCMNTSGGTRCQVRLLPNGKGKCKYRCTWEPYNERSPQFGGFTTRDKDIEQPKDVPRYETEPPPPSAWAS